jgi:hypothetical protein
MSAIPAIQTRVRQLRIGLSSRSARLFRGRRKPERWLRALPFVVFCLFFLSPQARIFHILGAVLALGLVAWAARRPGRALVALVVFLPFQTLGLGLLLRFHVPAQFLHQAGSIKEILSVGILLAAFHAMRSRRERLDRIDKAALCYVGVVTVLLVFPQLVTATPYGWSARLLAWRADCGYVLLFFGVRHAPISPRARRAFISAIMAIAAVTVAAGLYQWIRPDSYARFLINSLRQYQYRTSVLHLSRAVAQKDLFYLTNQNPLRVSSIFISPFDMGDFALIPLALSVEWIARRGRSLLVYALCAGLAGLLFASRVRADSLAAVVLTLLALTPTPKRPTVARWRLFAAVAVGACIVVPSLGGTRFTNGEGGAASNHGHLSEITAGIKELERYPLGYGLGSQPGVSERFVQPGSYSGQFTHDNSVLQVGDELGVEALIPWLLMVIFLLQGLGGAARRGDAFTGGVRLAFIGILVAGQYHHVFLTYPVPWILWAAVALAMRSTDDDRYRARTSGAETVRPAFL